MFYLRPVFGTLILSLAVTASAEQHRTITLNARKPSSLTRYALRRRQTIPLGDDFDKTDLQWFGNISVGTPSQTMGVLFDTGSSGVEITSTLCGDECANQHKFDPNASSTYIDFGDSSVETFGTCIGPTPVVGNNCQLALTDGADTITIAGITLPLVELFLITNQTEGFFQDKFDGIAGEIVYIAGTLMQQFPADQQFFTFFLTPRAQGNAELSFGVIDDTKFTGPLTYASLPADSGDWTLASPRIFVNGQTTSTLSANRTVIFDTGTTNVLFDEATATAIYALISPDIKPFDPLPGAFGIPCASIPNLPAEIAVQFTAQDGTPFNLTIPSQELSLGPFDEDPTTCQTLINVSEGLTLVGGSLLKHWFSVWDVGNQRMGFAANVA